MGTTTSRACCDIGAQKPDSLDSPCHFRPPLSVRDEKNNLSTNPKFVTNDDELSTNRDSLRSLCYEKSTEREHFEDDDLADESKDVNSRAKRISIVRGRSEACEDPHSKHFEMSQNDNLEIDNYSDTSPQRTPRRTNTNNPTEQQTTLHSKQNDLIIQQLQEMRNAMCRLEERNKSLEETCFQLKSDFQNERFDAEQRELDIIQRHYSELAKHESREVSWIENYEDRESSELREEITDQPRQTDDGIRRSFTGNLKPVGSPMAAGVQIPNHHFIETPQDSPTNGVSGENLEISDVNGEESAKFVKKLSLDSIESVGETQVFDMAAED